MNPVSPNLIQSLRRLILLRPRRQKQAAMVLADALGITLAVWGAYWLTTGSLQPVSIDVLSMTLAAAAVVIPIAWFNGLYQSIIRYIGIDLLTSGFKTVVISSVIIGSLSYYIELIQSPFRWAVAFFAFLLLYFVGGRFTARVFLNVRLGNREPVIIYGAGSGGARLTAALKSGGEFDPIALIDDNVLLRGKRLDGVEVYAPHNIEQLVQQTGATRILLAIPSASRHQRRAVLERLSNFPVHVQTIPQISDLVSGKARVDDIRDIDVADLLGRDAVPPDRRLLRASIDGKTVMVTGAGGSIGSELCRQIIHLGPKCLVLFEISEIALYTIERELRHTTEAEQIDCEIIGLLGSVHHESRVREVLKTYRICTVYHAAAYKHVPVVEHNILEGIYNNVFGTLHVARAAIEAGVHTFVLISTDKAVSPTSVMGATKRFAELILQALQQEHSATCFSMVRFGNVLASSGSVVPLFRDQIRRGGPVTVTHREIIRYFMTIPEAAQLVIQAGAMANGGDVFVLDMGQPVKIRELACRMINLMGLTVLDEQNPDGDIAIQYTGLRPGEKLYEELLIGKDVSGTHHPRILRANEDYAPLSVLLPIIEDLRHAATSLDCDRAREILRNVVAGYKPANAIDDLVWVRLHETQATDDFDKVIDISTRAGLEARRGSTQPAKI